MKKKNIYLILIFSTLMIASYLIFAQKKNGDETIPASQINESIQTFKQLINNENIQSFGLKSVEQLQSLKPGKQYHKYMIGLDDIKKYKAGEDVEKIIKELPSIEVSLTDASGKIQSSVEFVKNKDKWQSTGFGLTPDLKTLSNAQSMIADSTLKDGRLVRIPALHTSFIAVTSGTGLNFIILEDNESLGFRRGEMISASDAISKLTPVANLYNGLPQ